jgi:hypothetical protein
VRQGQRRKRKPAFGLLDRSRAEAVGAADEKNNGARALHHALFQVLGEFGRGPGVAARFESDDLGARRQSAHQGRIVFHFADSTGT